MNAVLNYDANTGNVSLGRRMVVGGLGGVIAAEVLALAWLALPLWMVPEGIKLVSTGYHLGLAAMPGLDNWLWHHPVVHRASVAGYVAVLGGSLGILAAVLWPHVTRRGVLAVSGGMAITAALLAVLGTLQPAWGQTGRLQPDYWWPMAAGWAVVAITLAASWAWQQLEDKVLERAKEDECWDLDVKGGER